MEVQSLCVSEIKYSFKTTRYQFMTKYAKIECENTEWEIQGHATKHHCYSLHCLIYTFTLMDCINLVIIQKCSMQRREDVESATHL